ncbi:hypothetical protein AJ79_00237 [Helicocarpus griseus UAMH5409]|uniref:F-box domain-containing protein n=1 Tax=Helicocarpus griseus UAMH5409 TaxID=1447875 RepID=A0A2B7Y3Y8_9EURO|nr:hypothetical protein AJ79_00237 [Helicocarpus griseus UAMH5409]
MAPTLRPLAPNPRQTSRPVRSSRKRVKTYREDSSEDELSFLNDMGVYDSDTSPRRRPLTYREDMSDSLSEQLVDATPDAAELPLLPAKVTRASSTRAKRSLFSKNKPESVKNPSPKRQKRQIKVEASHSGPPGIIAPWQKLPYHILLEIFNYAFNASGAKSLSDITKSVRWLLNTARLCRAFFEPAIAVLYYSPPLFPPSRLTGLVHLLEQPQETLFTNYRNKIKRLDILFRHYHVRHLDLGQLVALTPQLQHLRLHDAAQLAMPPPLNVKYRSHNWDNFLDALDANNIHLRSWTWNGEFLLSSPRFQLRKIAAVHTRPAFVSLQSLQFMNLPPISPTAEASGGDPDVCQLKPGEVLASAISLLPDLQQLDIQKCYNVDDDFLSSFDLSLKSLRIVNCENVTSANFGSFLARCGQNLRELVLEHNRNLNMSFTTDLAVSCPRLQEFTLDLNFTSPVSFTHDVDPHFDELLPDSEVPSWPSSLQVLKLERLRKWEISTAMLFFDALINSAPRLQNLRVLILSAILEIGWRDRAHFRKEWVGKLEKTYRRQSLPPNSRLQSIHKDITAGVRANGRSSEPNKRALARPVPRHSTRIAHQKSAENSDDEVSGDATGLSSASEPHYIQGMCDVVEIRVDNLRPADVLLTNDNFEDEEISGDEDWSGQDPDDADGYAW